MVADNFHGRAYYNEAILGDCHIRSGATWALPAPRGMELRGLKEHNMPTLRFYIAKQLKEKTGRK